MVINVKKIFAIILCMCIVTGTVAYADVSSGVKDKEYELWTQSPSITCGLTSDEVKIYKCLDRNTLELLPLEKIGPQYYLAICPYKMSDGGYSGKSDTTDFYFYTLYATETSFIILSATRAYNEYYWDKGYCLADLSGELDASYYTSNGSEIPYYILNPKGKYTSTHYSEYDEYFFVTSSGKIYRLGEYVDGGAEGYPFIKDNVLYRGADKYYVSSSDSYLNYYMSDGTTPACEARPIHLNNGNLQYGTAKKIVLADMKTENGYKFYKEGFASNLSFPSYMPIYGSDNLYFNTTQVKTLNSSNNKYYYYLHVNIYKSDNGIMTKLKTSVVPTTNTATATYTYQQINGLDEAYYINNGLLIPSVTIGTTAVITRDGSVCPLNLNTSVYSMNIYPCTYNGHFAIARATNGNYYIYKTDPDTNSYCYWQAINEISINSSGKVTLGSDLELKITSSAHAGQNGYFSTYSTWKASNFTYLSSNSVKSWWGRALDNVFPDGRYIETSWTEVGSNIFELWYNVYNADGTLRATGPTGYSMYYSSSLSTYDLIEWAINDSKFIICLPSLNNSFLKEYYRVAVVEETDTGEIVSKTQLGEKNITSPAGSDTEAVQSTIDFSMNDIPLGYKIKDNVIDTNKLNAALRNQVNCIRLNDVVIITKEGYQRGEQNTGVTLASYSNYDYAFGSAYIRMYTNGQYFRWYCNNPEDLAPGAYSKEIPIGDKTIYVTFRVIQPPTNEETTTVVF